MHNPIKSVLSVLSVLLCLCLPARAADAVQPQTLSAVNLYRDVTAIDYSSAVHFTQGAPLLFSNMVCWSTASGTNAVKQGLDSVTVQVALSTSSTTTGAWQTATVQVASNGTWYATTTNLPAVSVVYWQCKITDVNTNVYYYQQQMIHADPHL